MNAEHSFENNSVTILYLNLYLRSVYCILYIVYCPLTWYPKASRLRSSLVMRSLRITSHRYCYLYPIKLFLQVRVTTDNIDTLILIHIWLMASFQTSLGMISWDTASACLALTARETHAATSLPKSSLHCILPGPQIGHQSQCSHDVSGSSLSPSASSLAPLILPNPESSAVVAVAPLAQLGLSIPSEPPEHSCSAACARQQFRKLLTSSSGC